MRELRAVCVYCGSNAGNRPVYADRAAALGQRLAREGIAVVYGGGNVGLMGVVADAALEAGGEVIGVIPEQLVNWEVAHRGLTRLEVVADMHTRKMRMFDLSDAFIALPGGFGTLDEMFEMLTWRQLGLGDRPCAFLDVDGFYAPLMGMLDRMVAERFLHPEQRTDLWHGDDIDTLLDWMRAYKPAQADKWMDEKRRREIR
ncbi:cytokinin riboside 5'-monophosphate phosphoribohydrolase [Lysobacter xinjiangensis]|uniref:Cytokinin riboside 5'-monophosphate phosphoribohydrolase n=1 Tax=Cognatilysobacter xinjiangensis TaxID=546892 RepID=A0ABQ3BXA5_9GAMM|nr:TIGR00730 family Rossman fold protein [Lysobacter xinjiangensis]GGZ58318.1 cytokinin riboside 5'-monophosphate phosphoribohydrolase [Lysobacter xinjiangensis]